MTIRKLSWYLFIYFFVPTCQLGVPALAQSDSLNQARQLQEIQVRERLLPELKRSSVPVQVLSGQQLQRLHSLSVADAVRFFSGVQLKDYGGIGGLKTINVRSLGSSQVNVFYDGIQLGNMQNGQVDLGRFSLDNMEAISLFNGQKPGVLLPAKAYASAASVYMESRVPVFDNGAGANYRAGVRAGSYGLFNPFFATEQKIGRQLAARISTELTNAGGHYTFRRRIGSTDTAAVRQNTDIWSFRAEAGLYGKIEEKQDWQVKAYHYRSERGLPRAIVTNRFEARQRQWDENTFIQAKFREKISDKMSLALAGKYSHDRLKYVDPEITTDAGFLNNEFTSQEIYASATASYLICSFFEMGLSADYLHNRMQANLYRFPFPTRQTLLGAAVGRIKMPRLIGEINLLATAVDEHVRYYQQATDFRKLTPSVSFNWQPLAVLPVHIRAFYKEIFRMPTFNDLYYTFSGNSFLRPEYAHQFDLGMTTANNFKNGLVRTLDAQADVYFNKITDKIVAVPGQNLFRWSMTNLDQVEIRGAEANVRLSGQVGNRLGYALLFAYTYQEAIETTAGAEPRQQIPYIPRHSGSFTVSADYGPAGLSYSFVYTGERYAQKANIRSNYLQPWYTHDLSLHFQPAPKARQLSLTLEVNNLLNQQYDVIKNFPMPGRNYRIGLSWQFQKQERKTHEI
ncbi:TonB-dependent receptor [Pedobacter yulinensis]|nr:TonB-dependent receptor [Pedobacter yulinensis]